MDIDAIDRALGRDGSPATPLDAGLTPADRDERLRGALCFPDRELPTGELAEWAVALLELDKDTVVRAAVAALEQARTMAAGGGADAELADQVLAALRAWLDSPKDTADLRRLGDLWWSLIRNVPADAQTPVGDAASMAWWIAGYDPEGWGNPPEDPERLEGWLKEAADNRGGIVDVLGLVQQAVEPEQHGALVEAVRATVAARRNAESG